jgi:hypothetical protein
LDKHSTPESCKLQTPQTDKHNLAKPIKKEVRVSIERDEDFMDADKNNEVVNSPIDYVNQDPWSE